MTKIEELEKQVAEMKATIELMKVEEAKSKKFEFKYSNECYLVGTSKVIGDGGGGQSPSFLEHGRYRISEKVAKKSLDRNKRANRLESLAEQLGGLKDFEYDAENFYIYTKGGLNWVVSNPISVYEPEKVYTTKECAIEICKLLNEGLFSLDGEI